MLERTRGMKGLLCGLAACAGMTLSAGAMAGTIFVADGQDSRNGNLYVVEPSSGQVFSIAISRYTRWLMIQQGRHFMH